MKLRFGAAMFFVFVFVAVVTLLQLLSMIQAQRFEQRLVTAEKSISEISTLPTFRRDNNNAASSGFEQYPGNPGDWLVWAFAVEPKTLNQIAVDSDIYSRWMTFGPVFESLLTYNYDTVKLEPMLAKSYEVSDNGLEITFVLRDHIHFSDGVAVTADDVVFTYETIMNIKVDATNIASLFVNVDRVEKIDKFTVKFHLKQVDYTALENVAFYAIGVYPKHIYEFEDAEDFNKRVSNPVGSGPYVFEKWDVGSSISFRRNENYWGPKPKIDRVVYKFIKNDKARLQAFMAGDVDFVIPAPDQYAELVKDAEFTRKYKCLEYWNPGVPFYYIGWNQDTVFFADKMVRRAMTHLVDMDKLIKYLLKGAGRATTGPFYFDGPYTNPQITPWGYDSDKAAKLLAEAGWIDTDGDGIRDKDGKAFEFKFSYSADSTLYQGLVKLLKDEMAKVGVLLVPEPYEWSILLPRLSERKFDAMIMGWGGDIQEDFYQIFHSSQIGNRGANYVGFDNAKADGLMETIRRTLDEQQRYKLSHQLHSILYDEQPYTFLFTRPTFRLLDRRFENVLIHKMGVKEEEWFVPRAKQKYK
ncbi:MAG: hypothetical protein K8R02_05690 [Anaerohalosphaeraceae bacterium]|nr:hypothetical protein [Anaerohalosphaeraceae bacterium]